MDKTFLKAVVLAAATFALAACSSSEPAKTAEVKTDDAAKKAPAGPPEPVLGKTAFYEMYTPAHQWAPDMQPLSLTSGEISGVKNSEGKAGLWTAVFGSATLMQSRTYTYAVADQLPSISKGVKAEAAVPWRGPTTTAQTFQTSDFMTDSDAAYKAAATKAADWLKDPANAAKPWSMALGSASRFPSPVWYVVFGTEKNGYQAYISATTGNVITK
jgi:hypothetical protein